MQKPKHAAISLLILIVIAAHGLPVLQKLVGSNQTFWPIMAWGMYKKSRDSDKPPQTTKKRPVAVTSQGREWEVGPSDIGLSYYAFERLYITPMRKGDPGAAQQLVRQLKRDETIIEVRLESETYTITRTGLVKEVTAPIVYRLAN